MVLLLPSSCSSWWTSPRSCPPGSMRGRSSPNLRTSRIAAIPAATAGRGEAQGLRVHGQRNALVEGDAVWSTWRPIGHRAQVYPGRRKTHCRARAAAPRGRRAGVAALNRYSRSSAAGRIGARRAGVCALLVGGRARAAVGIGLRRAGVAAPAVASPALDGAVFEALLYRRCSTSFRSGRRLHRPRQRPRAAAVPGLMPSTSCCPGCPPSPTSCSTAGCSWNLGCCIGAGLVVEVVPFVAVAVACVLACVPALSPCPCRSTKFVCSCCCCCTKTNATASARPYAYCHVSSPQGFRGAFNWGRRSETPGSPRCFAE